MQQKLIKREFLAQALRAYLEPVEGPLDALDAANLAIEFFDGMGLLDASRIDWSDLEEVSDPAKSAVSA